MSTLWLELCQWRKLIEARMRGRPRSGWMDSVEVALGSKWMTEEAARQCMEDGMLRALAPEIDIACFLCYLDHIPTF